MVAKAHYTFGSTHWIASNLLYLAQLLKSCFELSKEFHSLNPPIGLCKDLLKLFILLSGITLQWKMGTPYLTHEANPYFTSDSSILLVRTENIALRVAKCIGISPVYCFLFYQHQLG